MHASTSKASKHVTALHKLQSLPICVQHEWMHTKCLKRKRVQPLTGKRLEVGACFSPLHNLLHHQPYGSHHRLAIRSQTHASTAQLWEAFCQGILLTYGIEKGPCATVHGENQQSAHGNKLPCDPIGDCIYYISNSQQCASKTCYIYLKLQTIKLILQYYPKLRVFLLSTTTKTRIASATSEQQRRLGLELINRVGKGVS